MARALFIRIAGAVGLIALSLVFVGLIPFISVGPSVGAGFNARFFPAAFVNHTFKGDRLPLPSDVNSAVTRNEAPRQPRNAKAVPEGCDPSFSPITTPQLAHVYGRCTT
jgi:hypothetical protein